MAESRTRPDLYVVARFLDRLCRADTTWSHSRLQAAVGLNYDLYRTYLAWLEGKDFAHRVTDAQGRETVQVTRAGLEARRELCGWIGRVLGESAMAGRRSKTDPAQER